MSKAQATESRVSSIRHLFTPYVEQDPLEWQRKNYFHYLCFVQKFRKVSPEELRIVDAAVDLITRATKTVEEVYEEEEEHEEKQGDDNANHGSNAPKAPSIFASRAIVPFFPRLNINSGESPSPIVSKDPSRTASPKLPETELYDPTSDPILDFQKLNIGSVRSIASLESDASKLQTNVAISNAHHAGLDAVEPPPSTTPAAISGHSAFPLSRNQIPPGATVPSTTFATTSASSSSPKTPSTPDELISLRAKLAVLLAPSSRQNSTFETHVFSFSTSGNILLSCYNVFFPVESEHLDTVSASTKFEMELCELLSSKDIDGKALEAILSIVGTVMVLKGEGWFNIGIKAWPMTTLGKGGDGNPKNGEESLVKVMFTVVKLGGMMGKG